MMYQVGDTVVYGSQGVCRIAEITEREIDGRRIEYYVLKPIYDNKSTIFVPIHNEKLTAKMRCVLTAEEIYSLMNAMPDEDTEWIENDNQRKERYKEILAKGDRLELVRLIKTLYLHEQNQKRVGKKLHVADEYFLKEAEKILYDEFAHVLNIKREQVMYFITEQINLNGMLPPKTGKPE